MNNRFLIEIGGVLKVRCIDCKKKCACIALPTFSMYFCENPLCPNNLELRYYDKGGRFEVFDYGAIFKNEEFQASVDKLLAEQMQYMLSGKPQPAQIFDLHGNKKPL